ncbi:uncharacterized protein J4E92_005585 [Alternaria infectoria]|uniref:uncharacterized protein n=1 Tax=Alternaria infectoria TaxID=45303 RepID=UPI00222123D3|nr:uncharacterized protein J4E92_005585 [Alternaria infectoria]KAI4928103.1 hypothetical protein J4E92_005585 [Alternaria infectoria]
MPADSKGRRNLSWAFGLFSLILISFHIFSSKEMDNLPAPFTIEIDGSPIAKVDGNAEDKTHAKTGTDAAVFELKGSRLQCDGHILGRAMVEDRSFLPKQVWWFKADTDVPVHKVTASQDGDSYQLKFSNAPLMVDDGGVFADLLGDNPSKVVLKMQS